MAGQRIDGLTMAWPDFAEALLDLARSGQVASVRAPRGCLAEAQRLVRDLELGERIEWLAPDEPRRPWARLLGTASLQRSKVRRTPLFVPFRTP